MDFDFTLIEVDWRLDRSCQCWVDIFRIHGWHLFLLEMEAKHSGGGIARLIIAGINIV